MASSVRNSITKSIEEVIETKKQGDRDRTAFGYLEPPGDIPKFAQCGNCLLWIKNKKQCYWFTAEKEVVAEASCILYVYGKPMEGNFKPVDAVTPEEVGFVNGKVRCENCDAFDPEESKCGIFYRINEELPTVFNLDEKVKPKACCNAFYRGKFRKEDFKEGEHEE